MEPSFSLDNLLPRLSSDAAVASGQAERILLALSRHAETIAREHGERSRALAARWQDVAQRLVGLGTGATASQAALAYAADAMRRGILTIDTLRQRGNNDLAHEAAGTPPVLDYEVGGDRRRPLPGTRPVNYMLLEILPPEGVEVDAGSGPT